MQKNTRDKNHALQEKKKKETNQICFNLIRLFPSENTFIELFGYSSEDGHNRPTNSEYIARLADKVRLDFRM